MSHLGSQLTALADGQLAPAAAERVLAHVAACDDCAVELAAARLARRMLAGAGDVQATADLTARLVALGTSADAAPTAPPGRSVRRGPRVDAAPGAGSLRLPGTRDHAADCLTGDLGASRVPARLAGGVLLGTAAVVGALLLLGDLPTVQPGAHPAEALTVLGHAAGPDAAASTVVHVPAAPPTTAGPSTAGSSGAGSSGAAVASAALWTDGSTPSAAADATPGAAPAPGAPDPDAPGGQEAVLAWVADGGWAVPAHLPPGYRIAAVREVPGHGRAVELDLTGPDGALVVTLERGRLATADVADAAGDPVVAPQHAVHVLSTAPWHAVWQCGDTVVSVVGESASPAVDELVGAYPAGAPDDGWTARIARGWGVLAGAWRS